MRHIKSVVFLSGIFLLSCGAGVSDYIEQLPKGYEFVSESSEQQLIHGTNILIPCTVLDYAYDNSYILAYQRPIKDCIDYPDELINNVDTLQYWIIDLQKDSLLGPYKKNDYEKKRQDLHIPNALRMKMEK